MKRLEKIAGIIPIVPTPFGTADEVDLGALRRLVDFAHAAGACAVCLPAYASEFYKLSEQERRDVVAVAVEQLAGRLPVIAQVNYASARLVVENAKRARDVGAGAICAAVPRIFPLAEKDLFRFFDAVLSAVDLPLLIQDVNPSGPSVTPRFVAELHRAHPHFRWIKLEEPMLSAKIEAVLEETGGEVGVLEGWGGMYMLELLRAGICGVMPGLALTDILSVAFRLAAAGQMEEAYEVHRQALPQIVYSLQTMEIFHHAEKMLLQARGILAEPRVREARVEPRPVDVEHIRFLNGRVLAALDRLGLPHNPVARPDMEIQNA